MQTLVSHLLQRPIFRQSKLSNVTDKTAIKYADRKNTNTPTLEYFVNFAYLKRLSVEIVVFSLTDTAAVSEVTSGEFLRYRA